MNILVLFATTEGHTRKIAEYLADTLRARGHTADVTDATHSADLDPSVYQGAILAASVHTERYQSSLVHYAKRWHKALDAIPSAFVSVSLSAASDDADEIADVEKLARSMFEAAGWHPLLVHHAAGALLFSKYDFFKRWIMKRIARQHGEILDPDADKEYTDWAALADFVEEFLAAAIARSAAP